MSTARLLWDIVERMREDKSVPWQLRSRLEELQWFEGYADGRDAEKGVVAANWNKIDRRHMSGDESYPGQLDHFMPRLERLFSAYGVEIEWSDQVSSCGQCYKCIQTEPDCMSWTPEFYVGDGDITCAKCLADDPESALEECEGNRWAIDSIDPDDHGYQDTGKEYYDESRAHAAMKAAGVKRYLVKWHRSYEYHVHVHASEAEKLAPKPVYNVEVSEDRWLEARECYEGWCIVCAEWTRDSTEPDAERYECPECGGKTVMGAENAMLAGFIQIEGDES